MKKLILTLATAAAWLVFNGSATLAQAPDKDWDARFGGVESDYLRSLQQTPDGGFILGGFSYSGSGADKSGNSRGGSDYWIVKLAADQTKVWNKTFGGADNDELKVIRRTSDGGYILGGTSLSSNTGDKTQATRGGADYWVVKIDQDGNRIWDKRYGGSGDDSLQSLKQTRDGGYILGGTSNSGASGDKSQSSRGAKDMWIVKITASGALEWERRFGGSGNDWLNSIQVTHPDDGYILAGTSTSPASGDKTQASRGGKDFWIIRLYNNGQKAWDYRFGGSADDELLSVRQDMRLGGFILGGSSSSGASGDKTQASWGGFDFWMVLVNGNGGKIWDRRFGGTGDEVMFDIQQTRDGGFIMGGYSFSPISGDKTQGSNGLIDFWTVKTTNGGAKQWDSRFGGNGIDLLYCLQQTTDDGYIFGGISNSRASGDKTQDSRGSYDFWIVKQGACVTSAHCNDNDACTTNACISDYCVYTPKNINDNNACTIDRCDPMYGVEHATRTCNDNDPCTSNNCNITFGCYFTPIAECCTSNAQCNDGKACTTDACLSNICSYTMTTCCTSDADCNDNNACTVDLCESGSCANLMLTCHDGNACTIDRCNAASGCYFTYTPSPGCCTSNSNCNDNNACTTDACNSGTCSNTMIPGCCTTNAQCNDGNVCTDDVCVSNRCSYSTAQRRVTSFTLVNSAAETDISPLASGSVINLSTTPNINVRANLCTNTGTGSVEFRLNGTRVMVEGGAPYAIASDVSGNYNNWSISPGTYTIEAIPYSGSGATGTVGTPLSITITVTGISSCTAQRTVASFTLVNSDTDMDIGPLTSGSVINLSVTPNVNVRANLCTNTGTGSVKFNLNGAHVRYENEAPYALAGGSPYDRWSVSPGSYAIQAIPYQNTNGGGTVGTGMTINVTVVNSSAKMAADEVTSFEEVDAAESANLSAFPNPFREELNIQFSLPRSEKARVEIMNMEGRLLAAPFDGKVNENELTTVKFEAGSLPEGMYFCRMTTGSGVMQNRKLMLLR